MLSLIPLLLGAGVEKTFVVTRTAAIVHREYVGEVAAAGVQVASGPEAVALEQLRAIVALDVSRFVSTLDPESASRFTSQHPAGSASEGELLADWSGIASSTVLLRSWTEFQDYVVVAFEARSSAGTRIVPVAVRRFGLTHFATDELEGHPVLDFVVSGRTQSSVQVR